MMDKQLVKNSFRRSIPTYNDDALVQKRICMRLMDFIPVNHYARVYEIGCGTGLLTELLLKRLAIDEFIINDLVEEMKPTIDKIINGKCRKWSFLPGDAETVNTPENIDLIVSASTIQWFHNPELFFRKMAESMKSGALFVFNTFGQQNFRESFAITATGLPYLTSEQLNEMLSRYFVVEATSEEIVKMRLANPNEVLLHFRRTGVNGLTYPKWTKARLLDYINQYERQYPHEGGVSLTYHPMYFVVRKK